MTPEQFLDFARVLPEPLLLVSIQGEILNLNQGSAKLLQRNRKELRGLHLFDLVEETGEQVQNYLQTCGRSRQLVLGSLTFALPNGESLLCRGEGGVLQPASGDSPALILLRLEKRAAANLDFAVLNRKIDELSQEIRRRQQIESQLVEKNQQLTDTLEQLKTTQFKLIQTEKMSSLGQLVAGISHEINNPVSFILGNLSHAEEYVQNLVQLVRFYEQEYPHPAANIEAYKQEIDLDFILKDLDSLLGSMRMGTQRILEIVKSLRNFSRLDQSDVKRVDIHEGIESTLVILRNRLQTSLRGAAIEVIRDYGDLPLIHCYPGQLNQVFMNLISNGIDALIEADLERNSEEIEQYPAQLCISTQQIEGEQIRITIKDNGLGICDKVCPHIFDPFFTTKPVGKGTGLGLSISYKIITDLHQGQLVCHSVPGKGSEFRVEIPIEQRVSKAQGQSVQRVNDVYLVS
ncbi:PAS domain-containing sensor histidine kinase [Spirulina subsalsa FACHB-351]|uniref:histidine kinase n=1 Tax=Spirulina subsalsa FACHB-351 TaxID=234711 RepID=A0ABT3L1R5_9CYAN|nr:ATP-binding protein [Spirulina subsalsa]MCW6035423.1 PAS domain-containing sensor histidine kinase [Spirulina subsalsa FACHB-351]